MPNNYSNIAANKFALIYEFNNSSPLFARVASDLIDNNKLDKAIDILGNGIKLYPNYSTAYFIYAKALALTGNIENAKQMVEAGNEILDDDDTKIYYMKLIGGIADKTHEFTQSKRVTFYDEDTDETSPPKAEVFEDNLTELAAKLDTAKIELPQEENLSAYEDEQPQEEKNELADEFDVSSLSEELISQTLAEIFLAQGNFKAAKAIFQKLLEAEPEKAEVYLAKIKDIDTKLNELNQS